MNRKETMILFSISVSFLFFTIFHSYSFQINVNSLELYDCDINEKVIDSFSQSLFLKKIELSYCRLEKYALKRGSLKNLTALEFDEGDIEDALGSKE